MASLGRAASGGELLSVGKVASLGEAALGGKVSSVDNVESLGGAALGDGSMSGRRVVSSRGAKSLGGAAVPVGRQMTVAKAAKGARLEVMARMQAAGCESHDIIASIVAACEAQHQIQWPPAAAAALSVPGNDHRKTMAPAASNLDTVADLSGNERSETRTPMALGAPVTVAMPPPQRSPFRTDKYRRLPRVHPRGFVRKAPVLQVAGASANPPTPPRTYPSNSSDNGNVTIEEVVRDSDFDGVDSVTAADTSEANVAHDIGDAVISAVQAAVANTGSLIAQEGNTAASSPTCVPADNTQSSASAAPDGAKQQAKSILGKRSKPRQHGGEGVASVAPPAVRMSSAADELTQQLAARSRNPRLCHAALWFPEAQSVLAASQRSSADRGLPSAAPPLWQNTGPGPVTASSGVMQSRTATRLLSLPRRSTSAQRTIDAFLFSTRD